MAYEDIPRGISQIGPGIFQADEATTFLSRDHLSWLKRQASKTEKKRARICLHKSNDDPVHEMVIAVHKDSYIAPHFHPNKEESFLLLEGACDILLFSEGGVVNERVALNPGFESNQHYFYRIGKNVCHTVQLRSDWIIFHEATRGPFTLKSNVVPDWVPDFASSNEAVVWINKL